MWAKVRDGFLVDGATRLTDFLCGQVGHIVGDMAHTVALGAGLKRSFRLDDLLPGLQVPASSKVSRIALLRRLMQRPLGLMFPPIQPPLRWRLGPALAMLWQPRSFSHCSANIQVCARGITQKVRVRP